MGFKRSSARMAATLAAVGALLITGACSPGGGSASVQDSPASAVTSEEGVAAARAAISAATVVPTSLPLSGSTPLPQAPAKGVKVAFVNCGLPACQAQSKAFKEAADTLGWDVTILTYDGAQPGIAVQQAINDGNKYIAMVSISASTITPQVEAAKARGIALFNVSTGVPQPGFAGQVNGPLYATRLGQLLADFMIADSGGTAKAVVVSVPIFPLFKTSFDGGQAELRKHCPGCSMDSLPVSLDQLGSGKVPSLVVSYLQQRPDIKYLWLSFADLYPGLPAALKTAGLSDRVKIIGQVAQRPQLQDMVNGVTVAWTMIAQDAALWSVVNWMAQLDAGKQISQESLDQGDLMTPYIVTTPDQAEAALATLGGDGQWPGPPGFQDQFKQLWKVG